MSTTRLPELPRSLMIACMCGSGLKYEVAVQVFDKVMADELHAYGLAVWKAAMDRAVAECEFAKPQNERSDWTEYAHGNARALDRAITAIRSLPLPEQGGPQERREG